MKEIRYIFNTVAILAGITTVVSILASIDADNTIAPQLLVFGGIMFFITFASGLVGLLTND